MWVGEGGLSPGCQDVLACSSSFWSFLSPPTLGSWEKTGCLCMMVNFTHGHERDKGCPGSWRNVTPGCISEGVSGRD